MEATHNNLNDAIAEMERITDKGQPFAKRNKVRQIRAVLRDMRMEQRRPPVLKDAWAYFVLWMFTYKGKGD